MCIRDRSDDELLDTEGGFTGWDDETGTGAAEETLEQALAEERLAELESELEQDEHPIDYEAELAVVIGRRAYNVSEAEALEYVFGYTILNDVSARTIQNQHKQWYRGKSLDGFTPMGPWIVTPEEFDVREPHCIRSRVNGELRQDSTTDLMIFHVAYVIAELSRGMTLLLSLIHI